MELNQDDLKSGPIVGLALSGGGARAMAYHLGCLRALHYAGVLERVSVISAVSGGAVIAAMFAYSTDDFTEFDKRVCKVLRRGMQSNILKQFFSFHLLFKSLWTSLTCGLFTFLIDVLHGLFEFVWLLVASSRGQTPTWLTRLRSPFRRRWSRTTALETVLDREVFEGVSINSPRRRNNIDVILNACELQTGSAFRFGSKESGSWRFGKIVDNNVKVSKAVAASAAYPLLLPALDCEFTFEGKDGTHKVGRVVLTDGGIYDNLGTTCLEPDRTDEFSLNVFPTTHIICCNAGHGQLSGSDAPYWWYSRMIKSFGITFKRAQDASLKRLHSLSQHNQIECFVLSYLGQQDGRLLVKPNDFVVKELVHAYPTDFRAMTALDLDLLSRRGEQITKLQIERYAKELLS